MMNWWTDRQRRKSLLDAVRFDTTCWLLEKKKHNAVEWSNGYGDTLRATTRSVVPGTGASLHDLRSLREFYRKEARRVGGGIVCVDLVSAGGLRSVMVIQKHQGHIEYHYKGSLIIPVANCEYRLSIESQEREVIGRRDASLAGHLIQRGELKLEVPSTTQAHGKVVGWFQDPYDPGDAGIATNAMSDDDRLDYFFPDHPLSKVRKYLKEIQSTLIVETTLDRDSLTGEHPALEESGSGPRRLISSSAVASLYMAHGERLAETKQYAEAARTYEIGIRELQLDGGRDRLLNAELLLNAGIAYNCLRQYADAETALSLARRVFEQVYGHDDTYTASAAMNLALVCISQDRHDEAEPLLTQASRVFLEKDQQGINAAIAINGLGLVLDNRGHYVEAIAKFKHALEIFERVKGAGFACCGTALTNMSLSFRKMGDEKSAEESLHEAHSRRNAETQRLLHDRFTHAEIEALKASPNLEIQRLLGKLKVD
jgi:tetratricopeptide (TPR) repeat protein